jgi:hypothetical protein
MRETLDVLGDSSIAFGPRVERAAAFIVQFGFEPLTVLRSRLPD